MSTPALPGRSFPAFLILHLGRRFLTSVLNLILLYLGFIALVPLPLVILMILFISLKLLTTSPKFSYNQLYFSLFIFFLVLG